MSLEHRYPAATPNAPTACVDLNLLLSSLKSTDTQVGAWVNVMGYVTEPAALDLKERKAKVDVPKGREVFVQAIMLWSAGSINLGEYERVLKERQEVERRL